MVNFAPFEDGGIQAYVDLVSEQMYVDATIPPPAFAATFADYVAGRERPLNELAAKLSEEYGKTFRAALEAALRASGETATLNTGLPRAGRATSPDAGEPIHPRERGPILHELTIGHLTFTVRENDEAIRAHNSRHQCSVHGFTNMSTQEIILATEDHEGHLLADGQKRTTLLHEVLHAAFETSGLEREGEDEERWINALQGPLLVALQDGWLTSSLDGEVRDCDAKWPVESMQHGLVGWHNPEVPTAATRTSVAVWSDDLLRLVDTDRELSKHEVEEYKAARDRLRKVVSRYDVREG